MKHLILLITIISFLYPCAVCYGAPDHPVTQGMNNGIMFLLFIVVFVLSSIVGSILVLMKRAKAVELEKEFK
tara:strand:- start:2379 stop:2594 length:216 start_codon:yes stop_codon:yes gene_type:complete